MDNEKTTFKITLRAECDYYLEAEDEAELDQIMNTVEGGAAMEKFFWDNLHDGDMIVEPVDIDEV
tara:strand:+ start:325 stop:519 length:195 start_codon:yes stop_codon:yes gene_type:complete